MMSTPRYQLRVEKVRSPSPVRVGTTFPLPDREVVVGRDPGAEVCLPDVHVSRCHARIAWDDARPWLERESRHAIFVNRQPVDARTRLRHLDWIQVGGILLRLYLDAAETSPVVEPMTIDERAPVDAPRGGACLVIDVRQGLAELCGRPLELRPATFAALVALASEAGRWVSPATLAEAIWADEAEANEAYITKYVSYLRAAMAAAVGDDDEVVERIRARVTACADAFTRRDEAAGAGLPRLLREFVKVRSRVGYRLHLWPDDVVWRD